MLIAVYLLSCSTKFEIVVDPVTVGKGSAANCALYGSYTEGSILPFIHCHLSAPAWQLAAGFFLRPHLSLLRRPIDRRRKIPQTVTQIPEVVGLDRCLFQIHPDGRRGAGLNTKPAGKIALIRQPHLGRDVGHFDAVGQEFLGLDKALLR